jgi:hypothetical protein
MKCRRCDRKYKGRGEWNAVFRRGVYVGLLCPDCQTPEENAEAAINQATLEYALDEHGRPMARPKFR